MNDFQSLGLIPGLATNYDPSPSASASQLERFLDTLTTLPRGPVEPTLFELEHEATKLGALLAPIGVRAGFVVVRGLPPCASPRLPLRFELALSDYPSRAPAELEAASVSLAFHSRLIVSLVREGEPPRPLEATLTPASAGSVAVTVAIPEGTCIDAEVVVSGVTFAGQAVTGGQALPVRLRVVTGMQAPLRLKGAVNYNGSAPVISSDGTLYAPKIGSSDVLVFADDGTPLPPLPLKTLGLSNSTRSAAFVEATGTLLLADANGATSKLMDVDAVSRAVRWSAALGGSCWGIAVLPAQGVVVASDYDNSKLHAHRLSDGTHIASVKASLPTFVAAEPATATVYASTSSKVSAFRWDGAALVAEGVVDAAGATHDCRPLAVVPPAPGQRTSYLVVGTFYSPTLRVLSLPDRRLVHTHELDGMQVMGLAADPSGTALAVCDRSSEAIHVLPWPLPGIPPPLPLQ
jgi:hypothetical protein